MEVYWFQPDTMRQLYDCSSRSYDDWQALGHPNIVIGVLFIVFGLFSWVMIIPFIFVFKKADMLKTPSYKIMFFICVVDVMSVFPASFYAGYGSFAGMVFCMAPTWEYVTGCLGLFFWIVDSGACMLLAFNRCTELLCPVTSERFFGGVKVCLWMMLPLLAGVYFALFQVPTTFTTVAYAFLFDPFTGTPERAGTVDWSDYPHYLQTGHNLLVVVVMSACYGFICYALYQKTRDTNAKMCRIQLRTTLQAIIICSGTFIVSLAHVYMQYMPTPVWLSAFGQLTWQFSHGVVGVSYFLLNKTMRRAWMSIFCSRIPVTPESTYSTPGKPRPGSGTLANSTKTLPTANQNFQ